MIRPNTSEEACPDLRAEPPTFDTCTVPLVIWARWPYNLAEAFGVVYSRLLGSVDSGDIAETGVVQPVLATPHGLRAPRSGAQLDSATFMIAKCASLSN